MYAPITVFNVVNWEPKLHNLAQLLSINQTALLGIAATKPSIFLIIINTIV